MHRIPLAVCAALLLGLWSAAGQAQWKWRDSAGQIHVSDMPPPRDIADRNVLQRPSIQQRLVAPAPAASAASAVAAAAPAARAQVDPELEARRKKLEQEQAALRKQEEDKIAAAKAENCQRAQAHLRTLDSGMRLTRVNDKGEREVIDDRQRAEEMQRARNVIASDCRR